MEDKNVKVVKKENVWKLATAVLGILLIIAIFTNGFNFKEQTSITGKAVALTEKEAANKAVEYINSYLLQPGISASLLSVKDTGDLYSVQIDIGGRIYDSYITKDGKLLFPSAVDLEGMSIVPPTQATQPQQAEIEPSVDRTSLIDDDTVKGDNNAPVTIIEFSDFECPFCTRFYKQTLPQIEEEYIKTGKVKFIYRDFPLSFHANAQKAAEAAECAADQKKFWEMHDLLFENGVSGGISSFKQYAADLNLDTDAFNECLDSGKYEDEVQKDFQDGQAAGVSGTPAFFINGRSISGAQPFSVFKQIIDEEIAKWT